MKKLILFLQMIFVYPVIVFSSLHVLKSSFDLKYALLQIWAKTLLKMGNVKVLLKHQELIPLENGYVFVSSHDSSFDALSLIHCLPVSTNFIFDHREKTPYLNIWFKRLQSLYISYKESNTSLNVPQLTTLMGQHNVTIFSKNLKNQALNPEIFKIFYEMKLTLIPISIQGNSNILKKGRFHTVNVEVCLPLHHEEYLDLSYEACLKELQLRITSVKPLL